MLLRLYEDDLSISHVNLIRKFDKLNARGNVHVNYKNAHVPRRN